MSKLKDRFRAAARKARASARAAGALARENPRVAAASSAASAAVERARSLSPLSRSRGGGGGGGRSLSPLGKKKKKAKDLRRLPTADHLPFPDEPDTCGFEGPKAKCIELGAGELDPTLGVRWEAGLDGLTGAHVSAFRPCIYEQECEPRRFYRRGPVELAADVTVKMQLVWLGVYVKYTVGKKGEEEEHWILEGGDVDDWPLSEVMMKLQDSVGQRRTVVFGTPARVATAMRENIEAERVSREAAEAKAEEAKEVKAAEEAAAAAAEAKADDDGASARRPPWLQKDGDEPMRPKSSGFLEDVIDPSSPLAKQREKKRFQFAAGDGSREHQPEEESASAAEAEALVPVDGDRPRSKSPSRGGGAGSHSPSPDDSSGGGRDTPSSRSSSSSRGKSQSQSPAPTMSRKMRKELALQEKLEKRRKADLGPQWVKFGFRRYIAKKQVVLGPDGMNIGEAKDNSRRSAELGQLGSAIASFNTVKGATGPVERSDWGRVGVELLKLSKVNVTEERIEVVKKYLKKKKLDKKTITFGHALYEDYITVQCAPGERHGAKFGSMVKTMAGQELYPIPSSGRKAKSRAVTAVSASSAGEEADRATTAMSVMSMLSVNLDDDGEEALLKGCAVWGFDRLKPPISRRKLVEKRRRKLRRRKKTGRRRGKGKGKREEEKMPESSSSSSSLTVGSFAGADDAEQEGAGGKEMEGKEEEEEEEEESEEEEDLEWNDAAANLSSFVVKSIEGLDLDSADSDIGDLDDDSEEDGMILMAAERAGVELGMELIEMNDVDLTKLAIAQVRKLLKIHRDSPRTFLFARPSRLHAQQHACLAVSEKFQEARLAMDKSHRDVIEVDCPASVGLGVLWRPSGKASAPTNGLTIRGFEQVYTVVTTGKRAGKKADVAGPVRGQLRTGIVEGMELATINGVGAAGLCASDVHVLLADFFAEHKKLGFGWPQYFKKNPETGERDPTPLDFVAEEERESAEEASAWSEFQEAQRAEIRKTEDDWHAEWRRRRGARRDVITMARQAKRDKDAREAAEAAAKLERDRINLLERARRAEREKQERIRAAKAAARAKRLAKQGQSVALRKAAEARLAAARAKAEELAKQPDAAPAELLAKYEASVDSMQFLTRQPDEDMALAYGMMYMSTGRAANKPHHPVAAEWAKGKGMGREFTMYRFNVEMERLRRRQHFKKLDACCYSDKSFLLSQQLMAFEMRKSHKQLREIQGQKKILEQIKKQKAKRLKLLAEGNLGAAKMLSMVNDEQVATYVRIYFNTSDSHDGLGYFHQFRGHDSAFNRRYGYAYAVDKSERSQRTYTGEARPGTYKPKTALGEAKKKSMSERQREAAELAKVRAVKGLYGKLGVAVLNGEQTSHGIPGSPKRAQEDGGPGSPKKKKKKKKKSYARKKKKTAWEQGSSRAARSVTERLAVLFAEKRLDAVEAAEEKAAEEAELKREKQKEKEKQRKKNKKKKKGKR